MSKTALLVVSFGTSYNETREKTIDKIEEKIANTFSDTDFKRAFTSGMIIEKIRKRDNIKINNVKEAIEEILQEGYSNILVQPTHIINGDEYEKMLEQLEPFIERFESVKVGAPLLTDSDDYDKVVEIISNEIGQLGEGEHAILMGHGTEHFIDVAYAALDYRFKAKGNRRIHVGTVEGYPMIEDIINELEYLKEKGEEVRKVKLLPFMIVAGDHAINDMASDEEDSWKTLLEQKGYEVECIVKGIGEYTQIQDMFVEHLKKVAEC